MPARYAPWRRCVPSELGIAHTPQRGALAVAAPALDLLPVAQGRAEAEPAVHGSRASAATPQGVGIDGARARGRNPGPAFPDASARPPCTNSPSRQACSRKKASSPAVGAASGFCPAVEHSRRSARCARSTASLSPGSSAPSCCNCSAQRGLEDPLSPAYSETLFSTTISRGSTGSSSGCAACRRGRNARRDRRLLTCERGLIGRLLDQRVSLPDQSCATLPLS